MKLIYATFAAAVMAAITAGEGRADEPVSDPTGVSPYGKTVCEGRTWDYYMGNIYLEGGYMVLYGYHFDGRQSVGEQEYAVFRDGDDNAIALMREEDEKIYLYVPSPDDDTLPQYEIMVDGMTITGEILLYDFSLNVGERFIIPGFDNGSGTHGMLFEFEVKATSTFEVDGENFITQQFCCVSEPTDEVFTAIEGVGNTEGLLPCPQMLVKINGLNSTNFRVIRVTDDKLGVLYENKELLADVETPVAAEEDSAIYDILGRRVTVPVAGNIYIRDGKKILWK